MQFSLIASIIEHFIPLLPALHRYPNKVQSDFSIACKILYS